MSTQYPQPNQLKDGLQSIPVPETICTGREIVGEIPSSNQPEELNQAMSDAATWTASFIVNSNVAPSANQPEEINPTIPVTTSWMAQEIMAETPPVNQTVTSWAASSFGSSNEVPSSYQSKGIIQAISINETSWMAHTIVNENEAPPVNQPEVTYPTTPVAQATWLAQIVAPPLIQPVEINQEQMIPIADGSYATQTMVNSNQTGVQWGIVMMYPTQGLDQSEQRNAAMPTEPEETWEVHPCIRASLDNLPAPQAIDTQPIEYASDSPGPLAIDENVQPENEEDNSTIAVPLRTDPNVTPELVTFRPGVYEGDAIPPVYSNFSIIAASSDYETHVPSPVYPNLSIIPEPVPEYQIITEPVTPDSENIIDEVEWAKSMTSAQSIAPENIEERPLAVEDTAEHQPTAISRPSTNSGYRAVDAQLLATLRDKNLILIYKDYHFIRHYCKGLKIKWQCVNRGCEAFLYSVGNKITVTYPVHNHLTITSRNVKSAQTPDNNAIYSLEEAISAMDDPVSSFNDGIDPNTLSAADTNTITLSYDHNYSPLNLQEKYAPQILATDGNPFYSNVTHLLLSSGNTIIPHDPSLEITVKSPRENVDDDLDTTITTILTSGPDPLGVCVATYTPPPQDLPQSEPDLTISRCLGPPLRPNYNHMTVPEDVKAKVTITSDTIISKPRVYYDGKYVPERTPSTDQTTERDSGLIPGFINANAPTVALAATYASTVSDVPYVTSIPTFTCQQVTVNNEISFARPAPVVMRTTAASSAPYTITSTITPGLVRSPNILELRRDLVAPTAFINKPRTVIDASTDTTSVVTASAPRNINSRLTISIPRSQILSGSDPRYTQLYNTFVPRALTQAPNQQVSLNEPNVTQGNISYSLSIPNLTDSPAISTGLKLCGSHRIPIIPIPRVSTPRASTPRVSTPRVSTPRASTPRPSRTMIPTGYSHRRSIRLARARNAQASPQNTNE